MTDKQYTAEDFANAEFARHPDGRIAARVDSGNLGWWAGGNERAEPSWMDDDDMAEEGFVPVREATAQPITLDTLQAAWEGAEQGEVAEGDVLIRRSGENFTVWVAGGGWSTEALSRSGHTRILHRAPKPKRPEGAERLEAMLRALVGDPALLADWLAERGVPVTEEGEQ